MLLGGALGWPCSHCPAWRAPRRQPRRRPPARRRRRRTRRRPRTAGSSAPTRTRPTRRTSPEAGAQGRGELGAVALVATTATATGAAPPTRTPPTRRTKAPSGRPRRTPGRAAGQFDPGRPGPASPTDRLLSQPEQPRSLRSEGRGRSTATTTPPAAGSHLRVELRQPRGHARHDLAGHPGSFGEGRLELPAAEHDGLHRSGGGDGGVPGRVDEQRQLTEEVARPDLATLRPLRVTLARPLTMTKNSRPRSPSFTRTCPSEMGMSVVRRESLRSSSWLQALNSGTSARCWM